MRQLLGLVEPAGGVEVEPLPHPGGPAAELRREGGEHLELGGGEHGAEAELGGGVGQAGEQHGVGLVGGEAGEAGAVAVDEAGAAVAAGLAVDRHAGGRQGLEVAVDGAHRHLELAGQLGRRHWPRVWSRSRSWTSRAARTSSTYVTNLDGHGRVAAYVRTMITWSQFTEEAPETVAVFRRRLDATGLALLATLRADGFPRISPARAADRRRPAVAGDDAGLDQDQGPAARPAAAACTPPPPTRTSPTATPSSGAGRSTSATTTTPAPATAPRLQGQDRPRRRGHAGGFDLFWLDLTGGSSLVLGDDCKHLRITSWTPGTPETITKRT